MEVELYEDSQGKANGYDICSTLCVLWMSEQESSQEIKKHWLKTLGSVGKKGGDPKGFNQRLQGVMSWVGINRHMEMNVAPGRLTEVQADEGLHNARKGGGGGMYRRPDSVLIA